jgi:hypothetical protein
MPPTIMPKPPVKVLYRMVTGAEPRTWLLIMVAARARTTRAIRI